MTKQVYDLPKTYTVAYYNPDTDENITLNQEQLKAITNPSEFKVINHGESYQSWKALADNPTYGPCYREEQIAICYGGRTYELGAASHYFLVILESEWGVDGQWFFGIPTYRSPKRFIDYHSQEAINFLESITSDTYDMNGISQNRLMRWRIALTNAEKAEKLLRYFATGELSVRGRGEKHHTGAENVVINTVRTALEVYRNGGSVNLCGREF